MNEHMRSLEQRRMSLVAQAQAQRQLLVAYGASASEAVRRFRLLALAVRGVAYIGRLWNRH